MFNLFHGLKTVLVGVLVSTGVAASPAVPAHTQNTVPAVYQVASASAKESPLSLNGENYLNVQGNYSYLGQSVKYLFLIPRKGGSFSGVVSGACQAQAGGNYDWGDGGKISGNVGGSCSLFGFKTQGSTKFSGRLYPGKKTIVLDIDNSPIHGFVIKYN